MSLSDPIADMLTRIRNAHRASLDVVEMPYSNLKGEVTRVLKKEGFVNDYVVEGGKRKLLRIYLRYNDERVPAINGIQRESRPGLRTYAGADGIPRVLAGLGVAILSTSSGVMTGKSARQKKIGGEVLCSVW